MDRCYSLRMVFAQLLFPDFALILCGYLVCRHTPLNRTVWEPVEMLVYFLLFPILLFHSIVKSPLDLSATSSLIGAGWALALTGIALAYSLPYWPWLRRFVPAREYAASAQVAFRFNSFIALALAERLAGPQGLLLIAVLIGVCVPLMNVAAVWPMARQGQRGFLRELIRNPLILGTGSGLLAAGAGMHLGALGHTKALSAALLTIRHVLLPLAALGFAALFGLDAIQTTVLLTFSALPTASSAYVLAARMGYDGAHVAALVTLSTLLGMLSLPFALGTLRGLSG